jgi:hypothetical protein
MDPLDELADGGSVGGCGIERWIWTGVRFVAASADPDERAAERLAWPRLEYWRQHQSSWVRSGLRRAVVGGLGFFVAALKWCVGRVRPELAGHRQCGRTLSAGVHMDAERFSDQDGGGGGVRRIV